MPRWLPASQWRIGNQKQAACCSAAGFGPFGQSLKHNDSAHTGGHMVWCASSMLAIDFSGVWMTPGTPSASFLEGSIFWRDTQFL